MIRNLQFNSPPDGTVDLLVVAGEASGDEHSALLVSGLLKKFSNFQISAIGGKRVEKEGAHLVYPLVEHAVVGVVEVLKNYSTFKQIFKNTIEWIIKYKPKTILLVDYPGFNLRLARELKKLGVSVKGGGTVKVLQYISPQLWAWKAKRRFEMEKILDGLGVIFPFEVDCYKDTSLPVAFVGHPFAQSEYKCPISYAPEGPLLLLPGSRVQPVQRILPVFLDTLDPLFIDFPNLQVSIPVPNSQIRTVVESLLSSRATIKDRINVVESDLKMEARAALMSSGTMSLSCAIAGVPGVIAYRAHPLTYLLGRFLVTIPFLGMANILIPEAPPYPEFLQGRANRKNLYQTILKVLQNEDSKENSQFVAKKLLKRLQVPDEQGVVEWLSQEISLV
ncbi:lipid-A-disaccharide synthase [Candidatus Seribacter sulfatis]|uniref:lipid-A-disaccharide synthase n=1 Tax=Candidatus Seribacter sulfatis TaxID=3381756 RepID=UPI0038998844